MNNYLKNMDLINAFNTEILNRICLILILNYPYEVYHI